MKRLLFTFLGMVMLMAAHATGYETINGLRYLIDTESQTAMLVAPTVKDTGDVVVPEKVTLAGIDYPVVAFAKECFSNCTSLKSITIPSSVTSLGKDCFWGCSSLVSIDIPSSVTSLGDECFRDCRSLTSITLPSSVTSLGKDCFWGCSSLVSIDIPSSVTSLGSWCFEGCSSLTSIDIPSSVTSLGESCFAGCSSLTSITIPSSVTSLGESCFSGCSSLTSVTIPSSVTSLGIQCFSGCSSLTSIDIPSSVTSLGVWCFEECKSLTSITLPSSLKSVGVHCFLRCDKLKSLYCYAVNLPRVVDAVGRSGGLGCPTTTLLYVPSTSVDKYKQADGWKDFIAILPIKGTEGDVKGKCEKPTITYAGGKLRFESATTGAEYHYTLTCSDVTSETYSKEGTVSLAAAYKITAYATADNYYTSDKATATLYWVNGNLQTTNINTVQTRGILASAQDGTVSLSGLDDGERVVFYSVDGKLIGSTTAVNGVASYAVGNVPVVIARIGDQSLKIAVR